MVNIRIQEAASFRIDEVYQYTRDRWGAAQADTYITGLFAAFDKIATHEVMSRPIPAAFGVEGFFFRYEKHIVYWRELGNGDIGIVAVLHERMHQIDRFRALTLCCFQARVCPHQYRTKRMKTLG